MAVGPTVEEIESSLRKAFDPEIGVRFMSVSPGLARAASDAIFDSLLEAGIVKIPLIENHHDFPGRNKVGMGSKPGTKFDVLSMDGDLIGTFEHQVAESN